MEKKNWMDLKKKKLNQPVLYTENVSVWISFKKKKNNFL